jgi:hypothetical protein
MSPSVGAMLNDLPRLRLGDLGPAVTVDAESPFRRTEVDVVCEKRPHELRNEIPAPIFLKAESLLLFSLAIAEQVSIPGKQALVGYLLLRSQQEGTSSLVSGMSDAMSCFNRG